MAMSKITPPYHQNISGTSATDGAQAFAGTVHGNVYYGNTVARQASASPKPCSTVPFRRDPDYVDRGDILTHIDKRCSQPAGRAALVGFGGSGKSQLAIEYAHRVHERSPEIWIFWVYASTTARFSETYSDIAVAAGLSLSNSAAENLHLVRRWLRDETNGQWLIIVDNADEEVTINIGKDGQTMSLASLLPQCDHGAVLITSRNADVARTLVGRQRDIITVDAMSADEAEQLLSNKLDNDPGDGARQLVQALEYIPLALAQAASYINRLSPLMTFSKYLDEISTMKKKTIRLSKAEADMRRDEQASNSVFATWQISFEYIRAKQPSAADLLAFMCFFDRQGIPESIVRQYTDGRTDANHEANVEQHNFEEDIAMLRSFSLVSLTQLKEQFEMHKLVQQATQIWLSYDKADERWRKYFIHVMAREFPDGEYTNWAKCRTLFPHVPSVAESRERGNVNMQEWAQVLNNAGWFALRQGLLKQADKILHKAWKARTEVFGHENPSTLTSADLLGIVFEYEGKYEEAETIHRQTLAAREKVLGHEHPDTLTSMNNLASVLGERGKMEEIETMHRQILTAREKVLGREHPATLTSMNNLAGVLGQRGKTEEAEAMHRQTLAAREKVLGHEHPATLTSMNNLAQVLGQRGKIEKAETMHRQTLAAREKVLGREHLDTLKSINNLAVMLGERGRIEEAETMHRQILTAREKVLGREHPATLTSMNNLAGVLSDQGENEEAETMHRQTLAAREKVLGREHPDTLTSMNDLAIVLGQRGKDEEAETIHRQTLAGREKVLGHEHLGTLVSMNNLAQVLGRRGKREEAEAMYR